MLLSIYIFRRSAVNARNEDLKMSENNAIVVMSWK